jgi:hypothetical protein
MALRQHDTAHADWDAATFLHHAKSLDQLVTDVQAGRVKLPEQATDVFPPKVLIADANAAERATAVRSDGTENSRARVSGNDASGATVADA